MYYNLPSRVKAENVFSLTDENKKAFLLAIEDKLKSETSVQLCFLLFKPIYLA